MKTNYFTPVVSQPWAILPEAWSTICNTVVSTNNEQFCASQVNQAGSAISTIQQPDQIAVIPITGPVVRYSDLFAALLGAIIIEQIQSGLQTAIADPVIQSIILHIDSPGSTVAGVHELANTIYAAKNIKPITAYVSSLGASAAYWLASSADEVVIDATAAVGSIGVISTIIDDTERKSKGRYR